MAVEGSREQDEHDVSEYFGWRELFWKLFLFVCRLRWRGARYEVLVFSWVKELESREVGNAVEVDWFVESRVGFRLMSGRGHEEQGGS